MSSQGREVLRIALLTLLLGAAYLITLNPYIGVTGDSAKFQFVGYVLGTPHPPGSPAYVLLSHFFTTWFPFGNPALKANLMSAIFAVMMSWFLYGTLKEFEVSSWIALATTLAFGLTQTLWSQSIVAELYALNALFVAATIFFFLRWERSGETGSFYAACLIYALSFGNHLTMVTLLPGIVYLVLAKEASVFRDVRKVVWVGTFILAGMALYVYPLWRSNDPTTVYLEMYTPDLPSFFNEITGARYKELMFSLPLRQVLFTNLPMFCKHLIHDCLILVPLAVLGVVVVRSVRRRVFLLLLLAGILTFALNYDFPGVEVYFIPAYMICSIFAGVGLQWIVTKYFSGKRLVQCAFVLIPLLFALVNYQSEKLYRAESQALELKRSLDLIPPHALIVPPGYKEAQYIWYMLLIEKYQSRKDLYVTAHNVKWNEIHGYLLHRKTYFSRLQRKDVPADLPVYCIGSVERCAPEDGLNATRLSSDLYRIKTDSN